MNMNELVAFQQIVRLQSFSRAAEVLYITQPALTKRIKQLETELGYSLLERKKGGHTLELTDQGKAFYEIAQKWQQMYEDSLNIRNMAFGKNLSFSAVNSIASDLVPVACASFCRAMPQVRLTFVQNSSMEIYNKLQEYQLDFGLAAEARYAKKIETIPILTEKLCVLAPISFSQNDILHTSELDPYEELRIPLNSEVDNWHDFWFGTSVTPRMLTTTIDLAAYLVNVSGGWVITPVSNAMKLIQKNPSLRTYKLDNSPPDRLIYLLRRPDHKKELIDTFIEHLTAHAQKDFSFSPGGRRPGESGQDF